MKARPELDQRGDAAVDVHAAARRLRNPCDQLEGRTLAGSVPADHAEGRAFRYGERHVSERCERLAGVQVPKDASLEQRAFERRELTPAVAAVDLRDVGEFDRVQSVPGCLT